MKRLEIYKFVGAVLATALVIQAVRMAGNHLVAPEAAHAPPVAAMGEPAAEPAAEVAVAPAEPAPAPEEPAQPAAQPASGIGALLAAADPKAGKAGTKLCAACHSFDKGGPNKVGPPLWNIVGTEKANRAGFAYSDGFAAMEGTWTYDELDAFLADPKGYVAGNKMIFPGIKEPGKRANVIAFLRTLSDAPAPLP